MDIKFSRLAILTLKFIDGEISATESEELDGIVSRNAQHRELFEQILDLRPLIKFIRLADKIKMDQFNKEIFASIEMDVRASQKRRARWRRILIICLVAMLLLGLGVSRAWIWQ
ncbi:hypothetical protein HB364_13990 [Pseudoflavitalea sp. X16]|uniref:hypothetical protein n=1 Tax=Paraflavitalea devenefica TaxID=2716334 RepID=UPI00141DEA2E|nr:hypothetical protein [Paraflavitalea devenefica]NII26200.1 hypothetical protein [Paraflavitalea devenefica]